MKMKKKAGATTAKKTAAKKKPAAKTPAPKKAAAKTAASTPGARVVAEPKKRAGTYTPSPVQGTGWAPFRYPPQ